MTITPKTYRTLLYINFREILSWRCLVIPVGISICILIKHPNERGFESILYLLTWPRAWFYFFILTIADAIVSATVWYYRERNPRYIAKMERVEQERQEKADAIKAEKKNISADE